MRFAYADPPYVGMARRHYGELAREVNHRLLIQHLVDDYPDGWALSCHSPSLRDLLPMCPPDVRVCAWVKPWCSWKPHVKRAFAWEPIIVRGGRAITRRVGADDTVRDWVSANVTLRRSVHGAKPETFCWWLFSFLNVQPGDELHDLFPGSGAVTRAFQTWIRTYRRQPVLL